MSPITPLILQESKSAKFGLEFRHQSPLKRSSFKTEQHVTAEQMIALNDNLEIWPTTPRIFTAVSKTAKFGLWGAVVSKWSNVSLIFFGSMMALWRPQIWYISVGPTGRNRLHKFIQIYPYCVGFSYLFKALTGGRFTSTCSLIIAPELPKTCENTILSNKTKTENPENADNTP